MAGMPTESVRWWYLPSWLGLDAPCVVLTWTWATSRNFQAALSFRPAAAMFLVVWSIYLLDRLIDVVRCTDWTQATGRLRFGRRYRPLFLVCFGFCITGIVALLIAGLPADVIWRAIFVALGLTVHFLAFVVPVIVRDKLPGKEFGVGLFFALGAYACLGYAAGMWPLLVSIGLVVAFNCLVIAARDADSDRANDPGGASRWWRTMTRDLFWCGAGLTMASGLAAIVARETSFYASVAAAFLGLTVLHRNSHRLSGDAVRAVADFALFTPLLVIGTPLACQAAG
jgi:MFS family permease